MLFTVESVNFTELLRQYTIFALSLGNKLGMKILFKSFESGSLLSEFPLLLALPLIFKFFLCGLLDAPFDGLLAVTLGLHCLLVDAQLLVHVRAD